MSAPPEFDVFGRIMTAERVPGGWQLFVLGADGMRSRADVFVPDFVQDHELAQYLDDLFHESATRSRPCVVRLSD